MPERGEVVEHLVDRGHVVDPRAGQARSAERATHDHRGQAHRGHLVQPRVVVAQIDQQHPVDPALGVPAAVDLQFGVVIRGHLQYQRGRAGAEFVLDAGDQADEERLGGQRFRRAVDHQTEGACPAVGQRAGGGTRRPAQFRGDAGDPAGVAAETPGRLFSAYDTAPLDTPAALAMSAMVGRFKQTSRCAAATLATST